MSGHKMRHEGGKGAENSYKDPAAVRPAGYGAPPAAAGAPPPGNGAPRRHAQPQRHYAQPQPQYAQPQPQYAQPQPQYAPGGFNGYAQRQQTPPPNVVYEMPAPNASYGYQQQQPGFQQLPVGAPPMQTQMMPPGQWTTGLFNIGEDPTNCVSTFFFPCITFGQIAEVIDQGTTSCLLAGSIWTAVALCFWATCFVRGLWRTKLRVKYNIPQDQIGDVCIHCCCEPCALCQEFRELKIRGLDPSMGWEYHRQQMYAQSIQPPMRAPQQAHMQR